MNDRASEVAERSIPVTSPGAAAQAIDHLVAQANLSRGRSGSEEREFSVNAAASVAKEAIRTLELSQRELTMALIRSQDRIHAVNTLASIKVRGLASEETIVTLLNTSLSLSRSTLVVFFDGTADPRAQGQLTAVDEAIDVARDLIRLNPKDELRSATADTALVATVAKGAGRYLAFFRPTHDPFLTEDMPVIEAIVSALRIMLAFNDVHHRELHRAVVQREHEVASALAQSMLAERPPHVPEMDFFARSIPASLAGGDFYVFGKMDDAVWFAVGDVAGKGLPAAIIMTRAVTACRMAFLERKDASAADVFARIEDELFDYLDEVGVFVTVVVGRFDRQSRQISLVNAGHSPIVFVRDGIAEFIAATVPPLGVIRHLVPTIMTLTMGDSDTLVLGSDGLAEQSNPEDELFGYDRFRELCLTTSQHSAPVMGEAIFDSIASFANGHDASDDSTLIILKTSEDFS